MKKILVITTLMLFLFLGCEEKQNIFEPRVSENSIEFPFEEKDHGKFMSIFRNNSNDSIPISLVMASQQKVLNDSQNYDFCPDIINLRKGISNPNWFIVNFNYPIQPENSIVNQNDHPNLISYALPIGTYLVTLMEAEGCNEDQYEVFDIKTNDGITEATVGG